MCATQYELNLGMKLRLLSVLKHQNAVFLSINIFCDQKVFNGISLTTFFQ